MSVKRKVIGLMRETYSMWERRAPLCPRHVQNLVHEKGVKVLVQPSSKRCFTDAEYEAVGATLTMDMSEADLLIGVKQVKEAEILPEKKYLFFAHVIKGQADNMALLNTMLEKKAHLIDYECLKRDGEADGQRIIAFGKYAGKAGMIDSLRGLGERLLFKGYTTPFLHIASSYMYRTLEEAEACVNSAGETFAKGDFLRGADIGPLVVTFTGDGNVASGALSVFQHLPHEMIDPGDLATVKREGNPGVIYGTVATPRNYTKRIGGGEFDYEEYLGTPSQYTSVFHERFLPYTSVLMNCMYWDAAYPKLITHDQMSAVWDAGNTNLLVLGDVTCDVGGSIEMLTKSTVIEEPFFLWRPDTREVAGTRTEEGVLVLGVDILPSELPLEASTHFGDLLEPIVDGILDGEYARDTPMGRMLARATITENGVLQKQYEYIPRLAKSQERKSLPGIQFVIRGHLFDTGLINKTLDLLEVLGVEFRIAELDVQRNFGLGAECPSRVILEVFATDNLDQILAAVRLQLERFPQAHATFEMVE
eukprot:m.168615 g.168615  ORF g.168615 m.168615 type:complete len:534 (+) comp18213_c0_seq6:223-1824(+)